MWPELQSTVLYPPAPPRPYRCDDYGDYIFMVSRLTPLKRADLLIERWPRRRGAASRRSSRGEGEERARLDALAERARRCRPHHAYRSAQRRRSCSITSRAAVPCAFPQFNEDYGFVTAEAFASRKAVVTCRDSGGPAELVRRCQRACLRADPEPRRCAREADGRSRARRAMGRRRSTAAR